MLAGAIYNSIILREPIAKGWSEDKKYCITTTGQTRYLLRVSPLAQYESKKILFSVMKQLAALDIPMCLPIEFGVCDDGVYVIHSWIDGVDLESILPLSSKTWLPESEQYALGLQAGQIARRIHSLPLPEPPKMWSAVFNREIDMTIRNYRQGSLRFEGDTDILNYIEENRYLLEDRPQSLLFSDYNILNMMYEHGNLKIIDFERFRVGDPWNEFNCIVWSAMASPHFATGQVHGYFDKQPPADFFCLLGVYNAILLLSLMSSWAVTSDFGRKATFKLAQNMLHWFSNMQVLIPLWYHSDYIVTQ